MRLNETADGVGNPLPIEDPPGFPKRVSGFSPISLSDRRDMKLGSADLHVHVAECREGDVLFLPPGWWHEVHSAASDLQGLSLSLNFWQETCFGIQAQDAEVEAGRWRYLRALDANDQLQQMESSQLMPAWMEAY